jgi:hypothetical protein
MAMPASGTIAIISSPQTCGSICAAVGLASGSLSTLSVAASKAAPHAMTEFYGFVQTTTTSNAPWTPKTVRFSAASPTTGTLGSSSCVLRSNCIGTSTAMVAGECYNVSLTYVISACTGTYADIDVRCGGVSKFYDRAVTGQKITGTVPTFTVRYGDAWCVQSCTDTGFKQASSAVCLNTVTNVSGSFTKGTPSYCCTYTGTGTANNIYISCVGGTGTIGSSYCVTSTLNVISTPLMALDESYDIQFCYELRSLAAGSYASVCFICNTALLCCAATTYCSVGVTDSIQICYGDTFCIVNDTYNAIPAYDSPACSNVIITGVYNGFGYFELVSPSTFNTYTA